MSKTIFLPGHFNQPLRIKANYVKVLRFNLVYDIFLKYMLHKGYGYSWDLNQANNQGIDKITIPGGAFADDLILFADSYEML